MTVKDAEYFKGFAEERRSFLNFLIRNRESLRNIWWNDFFREIKRNEFFECGLYNLRNCVYDKQYQMRLANLDSIEFSVYPELDLLKFPMGIWSKTMRELSLFFVTVTKEFCDCISKFENLEILNMSYSDLIGVSVLTNGRGIKEFIGSNLRVSDTNLIQLLWNMPNLLVLDLDNSTAVNNAVLQEISRSLPQLQKLNLSNTNRVDDAGIIGQFPLRMLTKLEELNMMSVRLITDASLKQFNFPHLKSLSFGYNKKISPQGLMDVTSRTPLLETLNLLYLKKIGDEIFPIIGKLGYLKRLNLQFCSNITFEKAVNFQNQSNLKYFRVFQRDISSRTEFDKLVKLISEQNGDGNISNNY